MNTLRLILTLVFIVNTARGSRPYRLNDPPSRESLYQRLLVLEARVAALEKEQDGEGQKDNRNSTSDTNNSSTSREDEDDSSQRADATSDTTEDQLDSEELELVETGREKRSIPKETAGQTHSDSFRPTGAVLPLDGIEDTMSSEISAEQTSAEEMEFALRKLSDKMRWNDFLFSRLHKEVKQLRTGANYHVLGDTGNGASGDDGEYFYTIDGSLLGVEDNGDRNINDLYDRLSQLQSTVDSVMNVIRDTNLSFITERSIDVDQDMRIMSTIQQLETQVDLNRQATLEEAKLQKSAIQSTEWRLNKTNRLVDTWMQASEAMKRSHMKIFSMLTEQRARFNALQSKTSHIELELAHLQVHVMNATRNHALSPIACDLSRSADYLRSDVNQIKKELGDQRHQMNEISEEVKRKSDERSLQDVRRAALSASEKIEKLDGDLRIVILNVNYSRNGLERLEAILPKACSESLFAHGIYKEYLLIKPSSDLPSVEVRCDREWTIIQQRTDGSEPFNKSFEQYRWPFGETRKDHWIGNEYIHALTWPMSMSCTVRFETWDVFDEHRLAVYHNFSVGDLASLYRLSIWDYDAGLSNLSDSMSFHNGRRFSSLDRDEDTSSTHCARYYAAGWWFANCAKSNLNGNFHLGILWFDMQNGDWLHLSRSRISINCIDTDSDARAASRPASTV